MPPRITRWKTPILAAMLTPIALAGGCRKPVYFPALSVTDAAIPADAFRAYDTDGDGKVDFLHFADAAGRVSRVGYAADAGGAPEVVDLDAVDFSDCRHLVLILDGFGYGLMKAYRDAGRFRVFHPPSRVVAPYPSMTDLCLVDALDLRKCRGFEAVYFDRPANRIKGGTSDYLAGKNEPYNEVLQYRAATLWDAIGYVAPWAVFGKEVNDAKRVFDRNASREVLAYFVSSAGVSTSSGATGQLRCLQRIEQFANQVVWETRGRTKVTILSDHGHSYTPAQRIPLAKHLTDRDWRLRNSLSGPRDVAYVRFGLVTYASFATESPQALAADVADCEGVELTSYAANGAVVVLGRDGSRATVRCKDGRYAYECASRDPLDLKDILAKLKGDSEGYYDADELLGATIGHTYPAPLQRLWRAHHGLADNTPDVMASLEDRFYSGAKGLASAVSIASTHGGLNNTNSVTFIMSTAGPLPPVMRSADVPKHMSKLLGQKWILRE